jgi:RHS repeat-associated protein
LRTENPWNSQVSTVATDASLYLAEPIAGEIRLATHENSAQDAPEIVGVTGWELTTLDNFTFVFSQSGQLEQIRDPFGGVVEIRANGIYHSDGQAITWTRDGAHGGRITSIVGPDNRVLTYNYTATSNDLARVTDPVGNTVEYQYEGNHHLTTVRDGRGVASVRHQYDGEGRLEKSFDASGREINYSYELEAANYEQRITRNGQTDTYRYDERGNVIEEIVGGIRRTRTFAELSDRRPSSLPTSETLWARVPDPLNPSALPATEIPLTTTFSYDNPADPTDHRGLLHQISDPSDDTITLRYDSEGRLASMVDARENAAAALAGRTPNPSLQIHYYNVPGNPLYGRPLAITDGAGVTTELVSHGNVNARNEFGKLKSFTRPVTSWQPDGSLLTTSSRFSFDYDSRGFPNVITDPLGNEITIQHNSYGQVTGHSRTRTNFNPDGSQGGTTTIASAYDYDAAGRRTKYWAPDNPRTAASETWTDGDAHGPTEETVYNEIGKPFKVYDASGRTTTYLYDNRGHLSQIAAPDGRTQEFLYDAGGRKQYAKDLAGRWTRFYHNAADQIVEERFLGSQRSTTDGAGDLVYRMEYDGAGRPWKRTDSAGNVTVYVHDLSGRLVFTQLPTGETLAVSYDENGNPVSLGDPSDPGRTQTREFDALNRLAAITYPAVEALDSGGNAVPIVSDERFEYDETGRRIAIYSRADAAKPLAERLVTRLLFNPSGHLTGAIDPAGQSTMYGRDETGNIVSQTDSKGHTTRFQYDPAGRRTGKRLPMGQTELTTYNADGQPLTTTNTANYTTTYTYAPSTGDLISRVSSDPQQSPVTFTYDPVTRQPASMTDEVGTTTFVYDARGRLESKHLSLGPPTGVDLTYSYHPNGKVGSVTTSTPGGAAAVYHYDESGRLSQVLDGTNPGVEYDYDASGQLHSARFGNNVSHTFTHDPLGQVRALAVTGPADAPITSYAYAIRADGRRAGVSESNGRTVTYAYDPLSRLLSEQIAGDPAPDAQGADPGPDSPLNGAIAYSYDAVGNRASRLVSDALRPVLASVSSYDYNSNDEITAGEESPLGSYPSGLERPGGSRITFDGQGNLVRRTTQTGDGPVTTDLILDTLHPSGLPQPIEEFRNGVLSTVYLTGLGPIGQRRPATGTFYYALDGAGNVRGLTDASGALTDSYDYDAFGNLLAQYVHGPQAPTENNVLFAGEHRDPDTGLYQLRQRLYNPTSGRLLTRDPFEGFLDKPVSLNPYVYAQNDPVNLADPSGAYPTLAVAMMRLQGYDPAQTLMNDLINRGQAEAIQDRVDAVRDLAAYIQSLMRTESSTVGGYSNSIYDTVISPQQLAQFLSQGIKSGTVPKSIANAVSDVLGLTLNKEVSLRTILSSASQSQIAFGETFASAFPGNLYSVGGTFTASHVGKSTPITEFYSVPTQIPIEIVPDWNRDGQIDDQDRGKVSWWNPWRFWINEDNDSSELGYTNDIPSSTRPDALKDDEGGLVVDGEDDLEDFFPVYLDLRAALQTFPPLQYSYSIRQPEEAVNIIFSDLEPQGDQDRRAGAYLRRPEVAKHYAESTVIRVTRFGIPVPVGFLEKITSDGKGVLLVEGKLATDRPLVVEVHDAAGDLKAQGTLNLKTSPVEHMFRMQNLSLAVNPLRLPPVNAEQVTIQVENRMFDWNFGPPNFPDAISNDSWFIFVHGCCTSQEEARGWHSEMFKRMFWSGSRARFLGITWRGDKSTKDFVVLPQGDGKTSDYHQNVIYAFQTGLGLAKFVNNLPGGSRTIAAHSLGNVLTSAAINDGTDGVPRTGDEMSVDAFYMLDAAVPLCAFDPSHFAGDSMIHPDWIGHDLHHTAYGWYDTFIGDSGDARSTLTWSGRFADVCSAARVVNYYSSGEEVLENNDGGLPSNLSLWEFFAFEPSTGVWKGVRSWAAQELAKGTPLPPGVGLITNKYDVHGGWGWNLSEYGRLVQPDPGPSTPYHLPPIPTDLSTHALTEFHVQPAFLPFRISGLLAPEGDPVASQLAADYIVRSLLLAEAIPAVSYATGSNPIAGGVEVENVNIDEEFLDVTTWPRRFKQPTLEYGIARRLEKRWLHSDVKNVPYSHTSRLFDSWVKNGDLDK